MRETYFFQGKLAGHEGCMSSFGAARFVGNKILLPDEAWVCVLMSWCKMLVKSLESFGMPGWGKTVNKIQFVRKLMDAFKQQVSPRMFFPIRKGRALPAREQGNRQSLRAARASCAKGPYTEQSGEIAKWCWHDCKRNMIYSQNCLSVYMLTPSQP